MLPLLFAPLLAAGGAGSSDGGWQPIGLQGESVLSFSVVSLEGKAALYAQTHSGLWRKIVAPGEAQDWQRIDKDLPHSALGASQIAAWRHVAGQPFRMYALAGPADARQLYRSEDGGTSWQALGPAVGQLRAPAFAVLPGPGGSPDVIMIATASRLQRSLDGGATWAPGGPWPDEAAAGDQPRPAKEGVIRELLVAENDSNRVLAISHAGQLWVSENAGLSWHEAGLEDAQVLAAGFAAGTGEWAASTRPGAPALLFSSDKMATWNSRPLPDDGAGPQGSQVVSLAAEPGILDSVYLATRGGRVFRTTNGGRTWEALGTPRAGHVVSLALLPATRSMLYAATDDGVWARPVAPVIPTTTPAATLMPSPTATPEATATATEPAATATPTQTVTSTPEPSATPTMTETPTATPTATRPTATATRRVSTPGPKPVTPTVTATASPSDRQEPPPVVPPAPVVPTSAPPPPVVGPTPTWSIR